MRKRSICQVYQGSQFFTPLSLKRRQPLPVLVDLSRGLPVIHDISLIGLPQETLSRDLAVNPDILDQSLQGDVVVFRADVPQDQKVELGSVEIGQTVELGLRDGCRGGLRERGHDVDFLGSVM